VSLIGLRLPGAAIGAVGSLRLISNENKNPEFQ